MEPCPLIDVAFNILNQTKENEKEALIKAVYRVQECLREETNGVILLALCHTLVEQSSQLLHDIPKNNADEFHLSTHLLQLLVETVKIAIETMIASKFGFSDAAIN